jgi:23S rRNA pseudouridine2457 synthase
MLSQFTREAGRESLADLDFVFSEDVYPVGRLDADSEGLLLLTDERSLTSSLLDPSKGHEREYWVQVEGLPTSEMLDSLQNGPVITVSGNAYKTRPCKVKLFQSPPLVPDRFPPVRFRKTVADSWLSITLAEGKNRQVRKMTAAVGLPTLRLIRARIGGFFLPVWIPGKVFSLSRADFMRSMDAFD